MLDTGLISDPRGLATATPCLIGHDSGQVMRALDLRCLDGLDLRVLPDRGLDIGYAWFQGVPLAWRSRIGDTPPIRHPRDHQWNGAFGGGLLATCGMRNVGAPSEGHGLHGEFDHTPASQVRVEQEHRDGQVILRVTGVIEEMNALTTHLRCERVIETTTGTAQVVIHDTVTNLGPRTEAAPFLYHVNIGAPLWAPGARLHMSSEHVDPRDEDSAAHLSSWRDAPPVSADAPERVFEHRVTPDPDGWAHAEVVNTAIGMGVTIAWCTQALPRLHQWVHPIRGAYALGIEPANCSLLGRAADRENGTLPTLEPGQVRCTTVRVSARLLRST
ncbi:aldose 1-epimerase family protein [Nonomuraea sp. NPDC026600]|uniref:aldose 1-epimerase family protein n=1 Tax=Nonomuraea sp. NPDC026600 TaxID=3155363 RepID=UPI0033E9CA05